METETEGDKIVKYWGARSKKLRHELAISAWMCSPVEKIMEDAKDNHNGAERDATTSLFKKWFCHDVSLFLLINFFFTLTNLFFNFIIDG